MVEIFVLILQGYQRYVSPFLRPRCRFFPSCSHYGRQALTLHGLRRGSVLFLKRLLRCHPWHSGGDDPVPPPSFDSLFLSNK